MKKLLNEIDQLQKEINSKGPFEEKFLKDIKEYFRIGLVYSSNALEGNTLTESETKIILEDGLTIPGKPLRDHFEVLGLSESFDLMHRLSNSQDLYEADLKNLHKLFYKRIDEINAGEYRKTKAIITGSKYNLPVPEKLDELISRFIFRFKEIRRTNHHPVEAAALIHKEFVFIHPFVDGNGRVARLLMNLVLLQAGYTIAIIPPILRPQYIQSLEKAHTDDSKFINLIADCLKETQKDYLRLIS